MKRRDGWYADIDPSADIAHPWQPCLQSDGYIVSARVWFRSEAECVDFIRSVVVGHGMIDEPAST